MTLRTKVSYQTYQDLDKGYSRWRSLFPWRLVSTLPTHSHTVSLFPSRVRLPYTVTCFLPPDGVRPFDVRRTGTHLGNDGVERVPNYVCLSYTSRVSDGVIRDLKKDKGVGEIVDRFHSILFLRKLIWTLLCLGETYILWVLLRISSDQKRRDFSINKTSTMWVP